MKQFQRINLILTSENIGKLIIFYPNAFYRCF